LTPPGNAHELNDALVFEIGETAAEARHRLWVDGEL
jgi:hypothetical protein